MGNNLFLFFDTETTGLNRYQDNLVQLAWVVTDQNGKILSENEWIIKPSGFTIPYMAEEVHGISTSHAKLYGVDLEDALEKFSSDAADATFIIAHNISFDFAVLKTAFSKCKLDYSLASLQQIDTMTISTNWCQLPKLNGISGFKRPKLEELHFRLFGKDFEGAHQALADTKATMKCFFALIDEGVIHIPEPIANSDKTETTIKTYNKPLERNITISDALIVLSESDALSDRLFVAQHHLLSDQLLHKLVRDSSLEVLLELAKRIELNEPLLDLLMDVHDIDGNDMVDSIKLEARLAYKGIPISSTTKEREKFLLKLEFNFRDYEGDGEDLLAFASAFLQNSLLSDDAKSVIFFSAVGYTDAVERQKINALTSGLTTFSINEHQKFLWQRINYLKEYNDEYMYADWLGISEDPFLSKEMVLAYINLICPFSENSKFIRTSFDVDDLHETIIPNILKLEVVDLEILTEIFCCLNKLSDSDDLLDEDSHTILLGMCSKHPKVNSDLIFELIKDGVIATEYFDFENSLITKEMIVRLVLNGNINEKTLTEIPENKKIPELLSLHKYVQFFSMIEKNLWRHSRSTKDKFLDIKTFYKSINGCDLSNPGSFKKNYIQTEDLPSLFHNDEDGDDVFLKVSTIHKTLISGCIFGTELKLKAVKWARHYDVKPLTTRRT